MKDAEIDSNKRMEINTTSKPDTFVIPCEEASPSNYQTEEPMGSVDYLEKVESPLNSNSNCLSNDDAPMNSFVSLEFNHDHVESIIDSKEFHDLSKAESILNESDMLDSNSDVDLDLPQIYLSEEENE